MRTCYINYFNTVCYYIMLYRFNWIPNEGNFQEYPYETEWLECEWKSIYDMTRLVTAFWYPWIRI